MRRVLRDHLQTAIRLLQDKFRGKFVRIVGYGGFGRVWYGGLNVRQLNHR
jgi:hypothetical protein